MAIRLLYVRKALDFACTSPHLSLTSFPMYFASFTVVFFCCVVDLNTISDACYLIILPNYGFCKALKPHLTINS